MRREQNRALEFPAEKWMRQYLLRTGLKWKRQAQWGYRIFDFWNFEKGLAVEVDGLTHDKPYDAARDEYNFKTSGIVVIRVSNYCHADAQDALTKIASECLWNERRRMLKLSPIKNAPDT